MTIDRRRFLTTTAAASLALGTGLASGATRVIARPRSRVSVVQDGSSPDVLVVGAGTFGLWTALHLQRLGARVTVVDAYGAGNSRQTSGGETRGVRTSYGDRPHGRLWTQWATKAIQKWTEWDEMGRERLLPRVFFNTGDLILRARSEPYIQDTRGHWDALGSPYEALTADEVAYRWPWIRFDDLEVALYEPAAGVVRARRAIESVARVFEEEGGTITLGRVSLGDRSGAMLANVTVDGGGTLTAGTIIFACGPWFPKMFPELMQNRIRIPIGYVFYFGVPPATPVSLTPRCQATEYPGAPVGRRSLRTIGGSGFVQVVVPQKIQTQAIDGFPPKRMSGRAKFWSNTFQTSWAPR